MTTTSKSPMAVIAAGIAGSTFTGLDQFSYEIYRGKPYSGNPRKLDLPEACKSALEQVSHQVDLQVNRPIVIVMNTRLMEYAASISSEVESILMEGDTLEAVFCRITGILEKDAGPVMLMDFVESSGTVSVLVLSACQIADRNHFKPLGFLTVSPDFDRENTNLMMVNGNLPKFISNPVSREFIRSSTETIHPDCALVDSTTGLFSVIKLLACMTRRMIPGVTGWDETDAEGIWSRSGFYVPGNSRSWFTPANQPQLFGSVVSVTDQEKLSFLNLRTPGDGIPDQITMPSMEDLCMFPFGGNTLEEIISQLATFKNTNFSQVNVQQAARFQYRRWQKNTPFAYTACILGSSPEELLREIDYAITGIPESAGKSSDWRTPAGSTFSPNPLGNSGSISFVYPGAFNSYPGVGQDLFRLFPSLFRRLSDISNNIGDLINERQLYPRRFDRILPAEMEQLEKDLVADPLAMLISGTCLAAVYTFLLRETFNLHPASSLGYSLGEISMMFASGVWTKADDTARALRQSPLFHNRMAGSQDAVREYWRKTGNNPSTENGRLWANFILMATYEKVVEALQGFDHVYVTHINTPRQVVIGGHPDECRQLIASIKCSSLEAPFNYALHCEAVESEYEALRDLHTWDIQNQPGMVLYSAATNAPMPMEQDAIARQIAHGLCHRLDFPKLVETAYSDGARIFIELGAGSNCTRWVDESLAGKPHMAFSINRKGVDDHSAILQMLARLISHGVPVNLSPVFG